MSSDEKILDFPKGGNTSDERAMRAMAEAKRLASLVFRSHQRIPKSA
jgi:hypothetical protein